MDYTKLTLGQLLSSDDVTIKRNAQSILKVCQRCDHTNENGRCIYCFKPEPASTVVVCKSCGWIKEGHKCENPDCQSNAL